MEYLYEGEDRGDCELRSSLDRLMRDADDPVLRGIVAQRCAPDGGAYVEEVVLGHVVRHVFRRSLVEGAEPDRMVHLDIAVALAREADHWMRRN